jgi:hypothetical protein
MSLTEAILTPAAHASQFLLHIFLLDSSLCQVFVQLLLRDIGCLVIEVSSGIRGARGSVLVHYATSRKVAGTRPNEVNKFLQFT